MSTHPQDARPSDYRRAVEAEARHIIGERRGGPLEVEALLTSDQRRTADPIDELVADLRRIEAEGGGRNP